MEEYIYPKDHNPDFLSILVPNVDNVRTDYLIHVVSKQGKVCNSFTYLGLNRLITLLHCSDFTIYIYINDFVRSATSGL